VSATSLRALAFLVLAGTLASATIATGEEDTGEEDRPFDPLALREAVRRLGDDSYDVRERATRELVSMGHVVANEIDEAHARSIDLEVRGRLDRVRRRLWGPGLVLRLPLAGHVRDASGLGHHGEAVPSQGSWHASGEPAVLDTAFDERFVRVPDRRMLRTDRACTIAAWVRPTKIVYQRLSWHANVPGEPEYPWGETHTQLHGHFVVAKWRSSGQNGEFLLAITPSGQLGLAVANGEKRFQFDALRTKRRIPLDRWSHVAATFDAGRMTLYVDGRVAATKTSKEVVRLDRSDYVHDAVYVGRLWADGYEFEGGIAEVFLYGRALEEESVDRLARHRRDELTADANP
jgi:hypothetical protein